MTINMHQGDEAFTVRIEGSNASFDGDVESREETFEASMTENDMQLEASMEENKQTFDADMGEVQLVPGGSSEPGKDGFSPIVDLTETAEGVQITVVDAEGEETALVRHGKDGRDGKDGLPGERGETGPAGPQGERGLQGIQGVPGEQGPQGIQGPAGKDGQPGERGQAGEPGQPGADGISPEVTVQDITGGHRVTITDKDGAKVFDVMDGKDGTGGGGESPAIVDVVELPTENINEDVFYRLLSGTFYYHGAPQGDWTCYLVETLPQEGVPVTTDMVHVSLYYAIDTSSVSGYIPPALAGVVGVPAGWYPVEVLAQAFDLLWGGIIWDESEAPEDSAIRLVLKYAVYHYKQEWANLSDKVGWKSQNGVGAEVFNSLRNVASVSYSHAEGYETTASGDYSHAEGRGTTASEYYSHAEGWDTTARGYCSHTEGYETTASEYCSHAEGEGTEASGYCSHAEGRDTTASGYCSHAEGRGTTASGNNSHAEGRETTASGHYSHAEGEGTEASGRGQHVQGRFNKIDTSATDPDGYGKYAHIVGNGEADYNRSNAHTLDWNGVAWYQGRPQFGGKAQDDGAQTVMGNGDEEIVLASPNGKLWGITVTDDGVLTVTAK